MSAPKGTRVECGPISWVPSPADPAKVRARFLLTLVDGDGKQIVIANPRRGLVPPEKDGETEAETLRRTIAENEPAEIALCYGWDERIDFLHPDRPGVEIMGGVEHDFPREGHPFAKAGAPTEAELQTEIGAVAKHWLEQLRTPGQPFAEPQASPVVHAPFTLEV